MKNNGDTKFADVSRQGGSFFRSEHRGRGLAVGDLNNDGHPDLVLSSVNEPVRVLRHAGTDKHWVGFDLKGAGFGDITGAKVSVESGGKTRTRFVKAGGSYLSAGDRRPVVGLGTTEKIDRVTVTWPAGEAGGKSEEFKGIVADGYWKIERGKATAERVGMKK